MTRFHATLVAAVGLKTVFLVCCIGFSSDLPSEASVTSGRSREEGEKCNGIVYIYIYIYI